MGYRVEYDLIGKREIPSEAYWGIHTLRAMENFRFDLPPVNSVLIRALAMVKKACCITNRELGYLSQEGAGGIESACDEIIGGAFSDQFPIPSLQGGAGTSTNMNINEVIANRALELLGKNRGEYSYCHPLEQVNLHQSTNDVYPTALKISAILGVRELSSAAACLQGAFQQKEKEYASIIKIGRTELQDAVPMTLGAQFASFADAVARDRWRTFKCEERLRVVNIGGTAVGTGLTAPRSYIFLVIEKLREICGCGLTRGENVIDQTANADVFVEVSGILSAHTANLVKIAGDLRMMHVFHEIRLPAVQAGSSIMPGKVNPVICEAIISAGLKVSANNTVITDCAGRGSLQLNEFMPLIASTLLESINILVSSDKILTDHVEKIEADSRIENNQVYQSTTLVTAFVPYIGYEKAQLIVSKFTESGRIDFHEYLINELGESLVEQILSPANLMSLGYREHQVEGLRKKIIDKG
jgi:aspartate ammonia-lyase